MFFNNNLVAVDIGSSSIKMMELSGSSGSCKIKSFGVQPLPRGAIDDGLIQDASLVTKTLSDLAIKLGVTGKRVSIGLNGSGVIVKKLSLPTGSDVGIDEQLPHHVEQALQMDVSNLYYDFHPLKSTQDDKGNSDVLLVGVRRETVEQFVACLKEANLRPGSIEPTATSLANAFEENYGIIDGLVSVVNMGASFTQLLFIRNGEFLFCRDIPIGGSTLTLKYAEALNQTFEQAEATKLASFQSGEFRTNDVIANIIRQFTDQVVQEINETYGYFSRSEGLDSGAGVKNVFLTGGASRTPGIDAAVANSFQARVFPLNPLQRVQVNEEKVSLDVLLSASSMICLAVGLGMRKLKDK